MSNDSSRLNYILSAFLYTVWPDFKWWAGQRHLRVRRFLTNPVHATSFSSGAVENNAPEEFSHVESFPSMLVPCFPQFLLLYAFLNRRFSHREGRNDI
jgi:hypothetical protein